MSSKEHQAKSIILGELIKNAREHVRRSPADCAAILNLTVDEYNALEKGERAVSLPDLELLALFLKVSMGYFWGSDKLDDLGQIDYGQMLTLRNRVVGITLRQKRLKARKSTKAMAEAVGISVKEIEAYETGNTPVPYLHLEEISKFLGVPLNDFVENEAGPLKRHEAEQQMLVSYRSLSPEMQEFFLKPVNIPYFETAKFLSDMEVTKLRALAENLLDITF